MHAVAILYGTKETNMRTVQPYAYSTRNHTIYVWYVPYAYGMYTVPYAYDMKYAYGTERMHA